MNDTASPAPDALVDLMLSYLPSSLPIPRGDVADGLAAVLAAVRAHASKETDAP